MRRAKNAAMLLSAALLLPCSARAQDPVRRPVVAIIEFTNSALVDHASYDPFRLGIASMLLSELRRNTQIQLVERERLRQVLDEIELGESDRVTPESAARAGRILGAHHIITGAFFIDRSGGLRLDARAISVETTGLEHVETVTDNADNLLRAVEQLGRQLSASLDLPPAPVPREQLEAARRGQMLANLKYARALVEDDRRNAQRAIALYREFLVESPQGYAMPFRREAQERIRVLGGSDIRNHLPLP